MESLNFIVRPGTIECTRAEIKGRAMTIARHFFPQESSNKSSVQWQNNADHVRVICVPNDSIVNKFGCNERVLLHDGVKRSPLCAVFAEQVELLHERQRDVVDIQVSPNLCSAKIAVAAIDYDVACSRHPSNRMPAQSRRRNPNRWRQSERLRHAST